MQSLIRSEKVLTGAFLAAGVLCALSYLFLEHTVVYRIVAFIFIALIWYESARLYTTVYAKLYMYFLLACSGLYVLHRHPSLLLPVTLGLLIGSLVITWCSLGMNKEALNIREVVSAAILFTLLTLLLGTTITGSVFVSAAIAMLASSWLSEMFRYRALERWRIALSYGILTLLLLLLIITSAVLR